MSTTLANPAPVDQAPSVEDADFEIYLNLDECDKTEVVFPQCPITPDPVDLFDNGFESADYITAKGFKKELLSKPPNLVYVKPLGPPENFRIPWAENYFDMEAMATELESFQPPTSLYSAVARDYDHRHSNPEGMFGAKVPAIKPNERHAPIFGKEIRHEFVFVEPDTESSMGLDWDRAGWKAPFMPVYSFDQKRAVVDVEPQMVNSIPIEFSQASGDPLTFFSPFTNKDVDMDDEEELEDDGIIAPWDRITEDETSDTEYDYVYNDYINRLVRIPKSQVSGSAESTPESDTDSDSDSDSDSDCSSDSDCDSFSSVSPRSSSRVISPLPKPRSTGTGSSSDFSSPLSSCKSSSRSGGSDADVDSEYLTTPVKAAKRKAKRTLTPKSAKKAKAPTPARKPVKTPTPTHKPAKKAATKVPATPKVDAPTPPASRSRIALKVSGTPKPVAPKPARSASIARKEFITPEPVSEWSAGTSAGDETSSFSACDDLMEYNAHREVSAAARNGKKFHCPEAGCNRVCGSAGDLRRHLESLAHRPHSFACLACDKPYTRVDALRRHHTSNPKCKRAHATLATARNQENADE